VTKKIIFLTILLAVLYSGYRLLPLVYRSNIEIITEKQDDLKNITNTIIPQPTNTIPLALPNYYLIKTAFIPQAPEKKWDQPWQDSCEEAALLTVDYYYKNLHPDVSTIKQDILNMITFETSQNMTHDINLNQMSLVAKDYLSYNSEILVNPNIQDLKDQIVKDLPVVVPANGKILYQENKYFKNGGPYYHNLVILGFDDSKQQFIVHDVGTQFGAYFHYSYDLLIESIHDFPDSGVKEDINSGTKQVLILIK
jgi:hypothetical protein